MKAIDCIWELKNIGEKTIEINIDKNDEIDIKEFESLFSDYQYVVVKVPMNMIEVNSLLSSMGFLMIETQISLSKKFKDFDFSDKLIKYLYPHVYMEEICSASVIDNLLDRISDSMFSTDRIYIDKHFPLGTSSHRYKRWIKSEFEAKTSVVSKIMYDEKWVGFGMERLNDGCYSGLLGGVFEEYQSGGMALCTGGIRFIDMHKRGLTFKKLKTSISSNNVPVVEVYNYLGFKIDNLSYVFVKHNK